MNDVIHDVRGLHAFVKESNAIEGIHRAPKHEELKGHLDFLAVKRPALGNIVHFVGVVAGAELRDTVGMDVYVGSHVPPSGGSQIPYKLGGILAKAFTVPDAHPYTVHCEYETLHPFTDGNGRSGRALWLWMMLRMPAGWTYPIPFLHEWYYQSLQFAQERR